MRQRAIYAAGGMAVLLLGWGTAAMLRVPLAGSPGPVAKIVFFYAPAALAAMLAAAAALVASLLYLRTKDLRYDALAVSATEAALVFLASNLGTGCIWDHAIRGIWWTWDPAITSALVCGLVYASYLMLRRAMEEPTQRAVFSAVWSIFCFLDAPMVMAAVYRWRTEHPQPLLWAGVPAGWIGPLASNAAGMVSVGLVLLLARFRQETTQRELDSLRRTWHVM
jgi:heme exporter protein C